MLSTLSKWNTSRSIARVATRCFSSGPAVFDLSGSFMVSCCLFRPLRSGISLKE